MSDLLNKIEQVMSFKKGNGIQYLLNEGYEILGNPIYIHDIEYKLQACTENVIIDDTLWIELITTGIHGEETVELFKNEYFIDAAANAQTIAFLVSDKLKYDRILGKIINRDNITVAYAYVVASKKPFEDNDPIIFETLCKKISNEIRKNKFYQAYGEIHLETMINKLIGGYVKDKRLYTNRVAEVYSGLKNYLYIAVADISKINSKYSKAVQLKNKIKKKQPMFKYAIYADYIVIIISSDKAKLNVKKDLRKLKDVMEENDICLGISNCFENLYQTQKYYIEASKALDYGLKSVGNQRIYLSDEILSPKDFKSEDI